MARLLAAAEARRPQAVLSMQPGGDMMMVAVALLRTLRARSLSPLAEFLPTQPKCCLFQPGRRTMRLSSAPPAAPP